MLSAARYWKNIRWLPNNTGDKTFSERSANVEHWLARSRKLRLIFWSVEFLCARFRKNTLNSSWSSMWIIRASGRRNLSIDAIDFGVLRKNKNPVLNQMLLSWPSSGTFYKCRLDRKSQREQGRASNKDERVRDERIDFHRIEALEPANSLGKRKGHSTASRIRSWAGFGELLRQCQ